jgi:hypothetical protein
MEVTVVVPKETKRIVVQFEEKVEAVRKTPKRNTYVFADPKEVENAPHLSSEIWLVEAFTRNEAYARFHLEYGKNTPCKLVSETIRNGLDF